MANFPIQQTIRGLPGTTGGVRAGLDVRTGEELVAGAVAGLGRGITALGLKFDLIEADTQESKAERLTKEEINRLGLSFNTNEDASTYQAEFEKSLEIIKGFRPKNHRAGRLFDKFYNDRLPQWQRGIEGSKLARQKDSFRAEGFLLQQQAISTGDVVPYLTHLEKGRTAVFDAYSDEEAERLGLDVVLKADYNTALNAIQLDPTDENVEEVLKNHPNLTAIQRVALRREARVVSSNRRAEADRQKRELNERTEKEGWNLWRDNNLTEKWVRDNIDNLSLASRYNFTTILDTEAALEIKRKAGLDKIAIEEDDAEVERMVVRMIDDGTMTETSLEEIASAYKWSPEKYEGHLRDLKRFGPIIEQNDPRIESEISKTVRLNPESITKEEIMGYVGKGRIGGLSLDVAERLADKWQMWKDIKDPAKKDPKTSTFAKRAHDTIDELEALGKKYGLRGAKAEKDWETSEDVSTFYNKLNEMHDALDVFMDTDPPPEKVRDFMDRLLFPAKKAQADGAIRKWWRGHMPVYIGGSAGWMSNWTAEPGTQFNRPRTEKEFNAQVRAIEDEDEAKAYYELWKDDFR